VNEKMAMRKPCARCGKSFQVYTPATKLCDECWEEASKHSNRRANKKSKMKENKKHPYKRSRK